MLGLDWAYRLRDGDEGGYVQSFLPMEYLTELLMALYL